MLIDAFELQTIQIKVLYFGYSIHTNQHNILSITSKFRIINIKKNRKIYRKGAINLTDRLSLTNLLDLRQLGNKMSVLRNSFTGECPA